MKTEDHSREPEAGRAVNIAAALRPLKMAMLWVALGFLAFAIWHARESLLELISTADLAPLGISVMFGAMAHLFAPVCSIAALRLICSDRGYGYMLAVHVRNLPARYLPGGVWHTVGRAQDFLADGMSKSELTALLVLESAMPVGVGLLISPLLMLWFGEFAGVERFALFAGVVVGAVTLILIPLVVRRISTTLVERVSLLPYFKLVSIYTLAWILLSLVFAWYIRAFVDIEQGAGILVLCATYVFSWSIGFLFIFAPQGFGVFELTAASLLPSGLDLVTGIGLVAGFRLIPIITDLSVWSVHEAGRALARLTDRSR